MSVPAAADGPPSPPSEPAGTDAAESPISSFLADSEERIQDLLADHRIPPQDTAELLYQALSMLVYRWGELSDPQAWLGATLRAHCQRYWRSRGTPPPGAGGAPVRSPGGAGGPEGMVLDFDPPETP